MIGIALTTEFTIPGGARWRGQTGIRDLPRARWSAWQRSLPSRPVSTVARWSGAAWRGWLDGSPGLAAAVGAAGGSPSRNASCGRPHHATPGWLYPRPGDWPRSAGAAHWRGRIRAQRRRKFPGV